MVCARCGSANEPECKFCTECGTSLTAGCPSCGSSNRPGSKFCGSCGQVLTSDAVPTQRAEEPAGIAQRRVVSVLFADLVGFTTVSQHRDAEDVREMLTRYFDAARIAVERHGGVVEKFIGDAVMAVWGTETAHEDDAERAVRAALEVLEVVAGLGSDLGLPLAARAGVLTGEAAVTVGATGQGMVAGDLVNTASRLQSAAEPGTVLVGEETYRASVDAVAFEPRGEIDVKGRDEPVAIWRALRVVGQRGGGGRAGRPEPPFTGRAEELRLVKELLHVTARERRARLVSITGIGGIGKSRLAWEFEKYVDGLSDDVFWHQGRCPAYGDGVTFWALGEMVRMRARIAETDAPDVARRKLADMLDRYLPDVDERAWVEPRFAHLLGLDDAPAGSQEELFSAWRTLFERVAEHGVTALVFEDVHWADPGLLDFIESIPEWSRNSGILVVTLARPELLDKRPNWGAGQRNYTALHLDALDDLAMTNLVAGFVHGLSDDDGQRIVARAEGVPLYAVETIRMLADSEVLAVDGAHYSLVGDIGALDVPGSLHALIAARLDVLPADDRDLLRDASVLGTSFTPGGLATIRDEAAEDLELRLRALVRKEFLLQDTDPRSPERGQYAFLQALIREVAYGTLSKADRRRKHLAVAAHFESIGDEELVGVVASHYLEALRSTPDGPEAEELARTAGERVTRAARRALSLGSPEQALSFAEQALELTPERERAPLLELAGVAGHQAGQASRAVAHLESAAEMYEAAGNLEAVARAAAHMSLPMSILGRNTEARERLLRARTLLPSDAEAAVRAELHIRLCQAMSFMGDRERALDYIEVALAEAERGGLMDLLTEGLAEKSGALFALGRHREALVLIRGAIDIATEEGNQKGRTITLLHLTTQLAEVSPRETYECGVEAIAAAHRAGIRPLEQVITANAVEAAIDYGRFEDGERMIDDLLPRLDDDFHRSGLQFSQAVLAAYQGNAELAESHLAAVESRMRADRMVAEQTWHLRALSLVKLLGHDADGAYEKGAQGVALEPTGMNAPSTLVQCAAAAAWLRDPARLRDTVAAMRLVPGPWIDRYRRGAEAALAALEGNADSAAAGYAQLLDEWLRAELPLDHAWCVVSALAVLPADLVSTDDVQRARSTLRELDAIPLLRRLEEAVPQAVS
jgi:class 3 adenylate cyclase/tetratricopeptide (TPR) repeat protein